MNDKAIFEAYENKIGYNPAEEVSAKEALDILIEYNLAAHEDTMPSIETVESEYKRFMEIFKDEISESFMKPELIQTGSEKIGDFFFIRLNASGYMDCTEYVWIQNSVDIGDWFLTYFGN